MYRLSERNDEELVGLFRSALPILCPVVDRLSGNAEFVISILLDASEEELQENDQGLFDLALRIDDLWQHSSADTCLEAIPVQVVAESRLGGLADELLGGIRRSPSLGEGSLEYDARLRAAGPIVPDRFLKNYVEFRELWPGGDCDDAVISANLSADSSPLLSLADLTQHAGIGIACELYSNRSPCPSNKIARRHSCALLAATWQLYRLGYFDSFDSSEWSTVSQPDSPILIGEHISSDRTLTLLSPSFIAVEHSVRLILRHLVVTPNVAGVEDDLLSRIGYFFFGPQWMAEL